MTDTCFVLYLGGPITGHADFNRPVFEKVANALEGVGYGVVSPLDVWKKHPPTFTKDHSFWMRHAFRQLLTVDGVAFLPWSIYSKGCRYEMAVAEALDLDVHPVSHWMTTWEYYV